MVQFTGGRPLDGDGNVEASFVYGQYIDEVLQLMRDEDGDGNPETPYYYLHDDMYNVLALTDGDGDIVERYEYGDYGYPTVYDSGDVETGNVSAYGNPYLFTGRRWDADTELYWYRTRYMDPALGRFISRDTIGLWGDMNNLGNPYAYVGNNPWSYLDPHGEIIESPWDLFSVGVGVVSLGYNVWQGNWQDAGLDVVGLVADVGATLIPGVPGGASVAIKAARLSAKATVKAAQIVDRANSATIAVDSTRGAYDAIQAGDIRAALINGGGAVLGGLGAIPGGRISRQADKVGGEASHAASRGVTNYRGEPVQIPVGHKMSPVDPPMSAKPVVEKGPFTDAQRSEFLKGNSGGTKISPHHRHQIPTAHGGVIDEIRGPSHPLGNSHTAGSPSRHPSSSVFNSMKDGKKLRASETKAHWKAKGRRLVQNRKGHWYDPGF